jgi:hypothetical protein
MSLYIARSAAVAARSLDDELIVMSARDSTLFTLNEVAREIWQAADGVTPLSDIVRERVQSKFETDIETACADAEAFCRELSKHGVLTISEQPIEGGA